ncbi:MAG: Epimerase family protein [Phycisphaerae bacterium]|nr:Epimerase family protein [Phycisphaerae bacterium]
MRIAVSGSSGLVGSALIPLLATAGHSVTRIVRTPPHEAELKLYWDPQTGRVDRRRLEGHDAVVHLAGENIAARRWSARVKSAIRESRVEGTRLLADAIAGLERPPKVLVCASAIGIYGDRGDDALGEESAPGKGFLSDVCRAWEQAADVARAKGVRVVHARFGVILSPKGGALHRMLPIFRMGLGGVLGSGRQHMSWISLGDAVGAIYHLTCHESVSGAVNVVTPGPVTNREFTRALGRVLRRPTAFPLPGFAARLAFGEMADALLLASAKVFPTQLLDSGYRFAHPQLEDALRTMLEKS